MRSVIESANLLGSYAAIAAVASAKNGKEDAKAAATYALAKELFASISESLLEYTNLATDTKKIIAWTIIPILSVTVGITVANNAGYKEFSFVKSIQIGVVYAIKEFCLNWLNNTLDTYTISISLANQSIYLNRNQNQLN